MQRTRTVSEPVAGSARVSRLCPGEIAIVRRGNRLFFQPGVFAAGVHQGRALAALEAEYLADKNQMNLAAPLLDTNLFAEVRIGEAVSAHA